MKIRRSFIKILIFLFIISLVVTLYSRSKSEEKYFPFFDMCLKKLEKGISSSNVISELEAKLKEEKNTSLFFYQFIKYLSRLSDRDVARWEEIILDLLISLEKGELELSDFSRKVIKEKLLYFLSLANYAKTGELKIEKVIPVWDKTKKSKKNIFVQFQVKRYVSQGMSMLDYIRDKIRERLSQVSRFNFLFNKASVLNSKIRIDYVLFINFYPYQYAIRNYFNRYVDKNDRVYYLYDYSDLDIDLRVDYKIKRVEDEKTIGFKRAFFTQSGNLTLYSGDYRFYHDVPYVWDYRRDIDIFDRYNFSLDDPYYEPNLNEINEAVKNIVTSVIEDRKDGLLSFIAQVFPIKGKVIQLDSNPDFIWINRGKKDGIYYKMRFVVLDESNEEKAILRARTLKENISRCRVHSLEGNKVFKVKVGDKVISRGY